MIAIVAVSAFSKVFLLIVAAVAGLTTGVAIRSYLERRRGRRK